MRNWIPPPPLFWTVLRDAEVVSHEPGCFAKLRWPSRRYGASIGGVSKSGMRPVAKCLEISPHVSKIRNHVALKNSVPGAYQISRHFETFEIFREWTFFVENWLCRTLHRITLDDLGARRKLLCVRFFKNLKNVSKCLEIEFRDIWRHFETFHLRARTRFRDTPEWTGLTSGGAS